MQEKICSWCKTSKLLNEFHASSKAADGHRTECIACRSKERKERYWANRERELAQSHARNKANPEARRQRGRLYRANNIELMRDRNRQKFRNNRQKQYASQTVKYAVKVGKIAPQAELYCAMCFGQALDYHHQSYHVDDRLNAVPLCKSCHAKCNYDKELLSAVCLPAVYLRMGPIRIAIVGLD